MYDARRRHVGALLMIGVLVAVTVIAVTSRPATAPGSPQPAYGAISGFARDAGAIPIPGIKVQAFLVNGSTYTPGAFAYTDALGSFALLVPPGTYRVLFTDPHATPHQVYADSAWGGPGYVELGANLTVTAQQFSGVQVTMLSASLIQVSVHRAGQWSTPLQGMTVRITYTAPSAVRYYKTDKNGSYARGGAPAGAYEILVSDPTNRFSSLEMPSVLTHALLPNDEWIASGAMSLVQSSANINVSKPSCNSSVKKGKKLAVSGTLSKHVTSKKMRLDAYQWSSGASAWVLNKQASLEISKSGKKSAYSGTIKLPHKGPWHLVAVFTGNSTYAESGSKYKSVTAN